MRAGGCERYCLILPIDWGYTFILLNDRSESRTLAEIALDRWEEDHLFWSVAMLAASLLIYIGGSQLRLGGKRKKYDYSKLPHFSKYDVGNGYLLDVSEGDSIELTVEAPLTYFHPCIRVPSNTVDKNPGRTCS